MQKRCIDRWSFTDKSWRLGRAETAELQRRCSVHRESCQALAQKMGFAHFDLFITMKFKELSRSPCVTVQLSCLPFPSMSWAR